MNSIVSCNIQGEKNMKLVEYKEHKDMRYSEEENKNIYVKKPRTLSYELNEKKAKTKLLKGAMKPKHMEIEIKSTCVNMRFDDGSFKEVVLPLLRNWNMKEEDSFEFMGAMVRIVESDAGVDNIKNHIDTKMVVMFDTHRIVLHGYNGTQNLMVQGKEFEKVALDYLKPYFSKEIEESRDVIDSFNKEVKFALGKPKIKAKNKNEQKKFGCPHCKVKSSTVSDLRMHLKSSHSLISKKNKITTLNEDLSLLDVSSTDMDETLNELSAKNPAIDCDWDPCEYKSSDKGQLMKHIEDEHIGFLKQKYLRNENTQPEFKSNNCDLRHKSSKESKTHEEQMHVFAQSEESHEEEVALRESVIICGSCAKSFESEKEFREHLCNHTTPDIINCGSCELTFLTALDLESHNETKHASQIYKQYVDPAITSVLRPENEVISCHFCAKIFKYPTDLDIHIERVHTVNSSEHQGDSANDIFIQQNETCFQCENCKFIGNASDLEKHINKKHGNLVSCKSCGINFSDADILKEHEARKHNTKPSPCDICGLVLANFLLLKEHTITIHSQTQESCRYCDFRANNNEDLETHLVYQHEEYIILHSMAKQMDIICEQFRTVETFGKQLSTYETFMTDILSVLKSLLEGQNAMKQELFVLRNSQYNTKPQNNLSGRFPAPSSPPARVTPSPPPPRQPVSRSPPLLRRSSPPRRSSSPTSSTPQRPQSQHRKYQCDQKQKTLYVGDSISTHARIDTLEKATNTRLVTAKAYSSVFETDHNIAKSATKFPETNFATVLPQKLQEDTFQNVIVQAGSVDISNLRTNVEPAKYSEYFKQEATMSAKNLFSVCEEAAKQNPSLKKIVILKQTPRYDPPSEDPLSVKPVLSELFNRTLEQCLQSSQVKNRIFLGTHNIDCTGAIREARYRETKSGKFDGLHLYGSSGSKAYTNSLLTILKLAGMVDPDFDHSSCPQARFQARRRTQVKNYFWQNDVDIRKTESGRAQLNTRYEIPTKNRFTSLADNFQGNF